MAIVFLSTRPPFIAGADIVSGLDQIADASGDVILRSPLLPKLAASE
jgi:hypothetical protein